MLKFVVLAVVCAVAQSVEFGGYGGPKEEQHLDYYTEPHYAFEYAVHDPHTGDIHSQKEERKGDLTHGEYSLVEADGSKRRVQYSVEGKSGFQAHVEKDNSEYAYKKPESNYYKRPESNYYQKPESNYNQKPESNFYQKPESNYYQKPESNYNQKPESSYYQKPESNYYQKPESNYYKKPESNYYKEQAYKHSSDYKTSSGYKVSGPSYSSASIYQSSSSYKPAGPSYYKPVPEYHQPAPVYHQPAPVYHKPAPAYHQPAPAYKPSYGGSDLATSSVSFSTKGAKITTSTKHIVPAKPHY